MRKMAREMDVNIAKTTLKSSPTEMQICHLRKQKRLARAKILLNKMKSCMDIGEIIFSNGKLFNFEAMFKR